MLVSIRQYFGPLDFSPQPNQTVQKHKKTQQREEASQHRGSGSACLLVGDL